MNHAELSEFLVSVVIEDGLSTGQAMNNAELREFLVYIVIEDTLAVLLCGPRISSSEKDRHHASTEPSPHSASDRPASPL